MNIRNILFVAFAIIPVALSAEVSDQLIAKLITDCPESVSENYAEALPRFVSALSGKKSDRLITLKAVVPRACFLELTPAQLQTSLQLGYYGLEQGLQPSTISDLTEIQSWRRVAKEAYVKLGRTYEKMLRAGAGTDEIAEVFYVAHDGTLNADQTEALTLLYAEHRSSGKTHRAALIAAKREAESIKKLKGTNTATFIVEKSPIRRLHAAPGAEAPTSDALWDQLENAIKAENGQVPPTSGEKKPVWNAEKLAVFFGDWKGTPYKWGGVTKNGIDCSGFVLKAIESQFPKSKYPRSASQLAKEGLEVERAKLVPGDLVFFAASDVPGRITHVGIFLSGNEFAHASSKYGVTAAKINDKYYAKRFVTARRLF